MCCNVSEQIINIPINQPGGALFHTPDQILKNMPGNSGMLTKFKIKLKSRYFTKASAPPCKPHIGFAP